MNSARREIGSGRAGTEETLAFLTRWKDFYSTLPIVREAALAIAGGQLDHQPEAQAAQLARFVKVSLVYQADPVGTELVQSPDRLLASIAERGMAPGDCDDHVLLFCVLAESLGIACSIAGVTTPGADRVNHVIAVCHFDGRDVDVDLCAKLNWQPTYPEKLIVEG